MRMAITTTTITTTAKTTVMKAMMMKMLPETLIQRNRRDEILTSFIEDLFVIHWLHVWVVDVWVDVLASPVGVGPGFIRVPQGVEVCLYQHPKDVAHDPVGCPFQHLYWLLVRKRDDKT